MSRFNRTATAPRPAVGAIRSESTASTVTAMGGAGFVRDTESELFLLGVTNFVGQDAFHEKAGARDDRYAVLIRQLAVTDDGFQFLRGFLPWLRDEGGLRTAPFVGAAHTVAARRGMPDEKNELSDLVAGTLLRADEPGELFAFWDVTYGGQHPKALKRGAAKAIVRLYTEWSALKWDTPSKAYRFGRMLDLTHPKLEAVIDAAPVETPGGRALRPAAVANGVVAKRALFGFLGRRMRGKDSEIPQELPAFQARAAMDAVPADERRAWLGNVDNWPLLRASGMTWKNASSWLNGPLDTTFWAALIPTMPIQALLMNLRNFDQAGIDDGSVEFVIGKLTDKVQVQRARVLPIQVLSAYRATAHSLNWGKALSKTLEHSLSNIPEFDGDTLIMVDTSTSMENRLSADSEVMRWDAAVVFAVALAKRCNEAEIVSFSSKQRFYGDPRGANTRVFPAKPGEAMLKTVERWKAEGYFLGGGTDTAAALRLHVKSKHTRVIIVTDEQAGVDLLDVDRSVPSAIPMVTLNLAGYRVGHAPSGNLKRVTIGGFNDSAFKLLSALDRAQGRWPWENQAA